MSDDNAEPSADLTMPTGNGPVDLEIAREEDDLAKTRGTRGTDDYWGQHAELHRKHDEDATAPDAPLRLPTSKAADGTLGDMIDEWAAFSEAERRRYVIHLGGGSLTYSTMESFRHHTRDRDG